MRILILGGTGAMGVHLVELLSKKDVHLVVTSRGFLQSKENVEYVQGNAKDINFIEEILKDKWDVIIDFMVYTTQVFRDRVNLFLEATDQYVFISSARVYAQSEEPLKETSSRLLDTCTDQDYLQTDEYALSKARQENVLRDTGLKNWTIIRPYITYSEIRLQLGVLEKESWLYRAIHGRTIVFSSEIYNKLTTLTYGFDVANAIAGLVGLDKANGQVYHITANQSMTWENVLNIYLKVIEKKIGFRPKVLLQNTNEFLKHHQGKYQVLYDRAYNRVFDSSKVYQIVDENSFYTFEKGLTKCLEEFLANPVFKSINWKTEAVKDKQSKEHTPLREIKGLKQKIKYLVYRYLKK